MPDPIVKLNARARGEQTQRWAWKVIREMGPEKAIEGF